MKKIITILSLISLIFAFFAPIPVFASDDFLNLGEQEGFAGGEIPDAFGEDSDPIDMRNIVGNIIKAILGLLGIIFLILLIWAGFKYMTAAGNEEQITEAKKQILQAVIGLIIIFASYAITLFVLELMVKGVDDFWIF